MSQDVINQSSKKWTSPLLQVVFNLRDMRNSEKDYLMGRILTLLDSVIMNERQNKAVKDIAKTIFWENNYYWSDIEELLGQFKDKYCPKVEDGYLHKIDRKENVPVQDFFKDF